jgi:5-methylcytosine-specific restriction endonuclease McrA
MIPVKVKRAVLARDDHQCVLRSFGCTMQATDADHRVGRGMGGNPRLDVPVNLVAACRICNGLKEADALFARECRRRGLRIERSQSTATDLERAGRIPVQYPDGSWWLLTATGREQLRPDEVNELIALHGLETV